MLHTTPCPKCAHPYIPSPDTSWDGFHINGRIIGRVVEYGPLRKLKLTANNTARAHLHSIRNNGVADVKIEPRIFHAAGLISITPEAAPIAYDLVNDCLWWQSMYAVESLTEELMCRGRAILDYGGPIGAS